MAILLHFFFLSAFAWMLVEGLHLYSMVVKVFGSEGSKHFYYYGIGWGKSARCSQTLYLLILSHLYDYNLRAFISVTNGFVVNVKGQMSPPFFPSLPVKLFKELGSSSDRLL